MFTGLSTLRDKEKEKKPPSEQALKLQAYLAAQYGGGASGAGEVVANKKKKRKKKAPAVGPGVRILDHDVSGFAAVPTRKKGPAVARLATEEEDEDDEDQPVIANPEEAERLRLLAERERQYFGHRDDGSGWAQQASPGSSPDASPPRRQQRHDSPDASPPRRQQRHDSPDASPPRRQRRHDSPDASPPRRGQLHDSPDASPPRRGQRHDSPDASPPRRGQRHDSPDASPPRRQRHDSPAASPPRQRRHDSPGNASPPRRRRHDSPKDASPPRRGRQQGSADLSPPRKRGAASEGGSGREEEESEAAKRQRLMSDGTLAGMVSGRELMVEMQRKREAERKRFSDLGQDVTGKGAQTVYRDKEGRAVTKEEFQEQQAKARKKAEYEAERDLAWGGGLKQRQEAEARAAEMQREAAKPFARTRDDADLDQLQREQLRWGDPMAHLVRKKQPLLDEPPPLLQGAHGERLKKSGFIVPQEVPPHSWLRRGVGPPPNRYGIKPGRHWDGVDRSNGFEQKMFRTQNELKRREQEAWQWAQEDM